MRKNDYDILNVNSAGRNGRDRALVSDQSCQQMTDVCYQKVRKIADCDKKSGYSVPKLDGIVETVIKDVFRRMKGLS